MINGQLGWSRLFFKAGIQVDPGNYRGISVLSCLGKLYTSVLNQRLLKFVLDNNILRPEQLGFVKENMNEWMNELMNEWSIFPEMKIYKKVLHASNNVNQHKLIEYDRVSGGGQIKS